ncbi:MAG TPA: hypothetical protein VN903_10770 [Polyangia bacterium]|nr:hypothetical protein [Polyangia bacterium]
MSAPSNYGQFYWRIVGAVGDVHLHADAIRVVDGALLCLRRREGGPDELLFAVAPGAWRYFYAASLIDGGAVSVEHWTTERDRAADESVAGSLRRAEIKAQKGAARG